MHLIGGPGKFALTMEHSLASEASEKHKAFAQFIAQYGRSYASKDTAEERFNIFSANFDQIKAHNANENRTFEMGINAFTDMTVEELNKRYLSVKLRVPQHVTQSRLLASDNNFVNVADLPTEINWTAKGKVSPSVDQGGCGSCWAFTTATTMESLFAISNEGQPVPRFSVQYLMECDDTNYGCDGGWMTDAYSWTIDNGIIDWSSYPKEY